MDASKGGGDAFRRAGCIPPIRPLRLPDARMAAPPASARDGASVTFRTGLHPVVLGSGAGFAAFVLLAGSLLVLHNDLDPTTTGLVVGGTLALAIVGTLPSWFRWRSGSLAIVDGRFVARVGLWPLRRVDMPLREIGEVDVETSTIGRWLGYGRIHVTSREGLVETFAHVADAGGLRVALLDGDRGGRRRR